MPFEDIIAWVSVVVITVLCNFLRLIRVPFIVAAILIAVSAIWAMAINVSLAWNWTIVFNLGRYAFYCLISGLILVIIRHVRDEGG
jgi:hypothetical protein